MQDSKDISIKYDGEGSVDDTVSAHKGFLWMFGVMVLCVYQWFRDGLGI